MNLVEARRFARNTRPTRVRANDYFPFAGGLNLEDTPLAIQPGELIGCKNYEPGIRGGYARVDGFERFDGQPKPSDADFLHVVIDNTTPGNYPDIGDTVTGGTSGATGVLLVDVTATPAVVLGRVDGTFVDDETLVANAVNFGDVNGTPAQNFAPTDEDTKTYRIAAQEDQREQIAKVPGEGPVRGVARLNGVAYAFRDNVGATESKMFKATAAGWVEITLNVHLHFDDVATQVTATEGGTVTGATSGATATVDRVGYYDGAVGSDSGRGFLVLSGITGTFQDDEILTIGADNIGTANGVAAVPVLAPGGRFEFRVHNFFGHTKTRRLYGVDGKNKGFEYDDDGIFSQITTNMVTDTPVHIGVHQNQLWFLFPGGSVQKSGVGVPLTWTVVTGAGEIALGAEGVGFIEEVGEIMFVLTSERTYYIKGREGSYLLDEYNYETGAGEWTIQRIGQGLYLDARGFASLAATDKFGNFAYSSLSAKILKLVNQLRGTETASVISRTKNLYRCFFADGRYIAIGVEGSKITGMTPCDLGFQVTCTDSSPDESGAESILYGADDGFVYEADRGTSFDGETIEAFGRLAFHFSRTPTQRKKYRLGIADVDTTGPTTLSVGINFSFGSTDDLGTSIDTSLPGGGGFWDIDNWDEFRWSVGVVQQAKFKIRGAGTNIGILFYHSAADEASHTLQGITFHYSPRRLSRRAA